MRARPRVRTDAVGQALGAVIVGASGAVQLVKRFGGPPPRQEHLGEGAAKVTAQAHQLPAIGALEAVPAGVLCLLELVVPHLEHGECEQADHVHLAFDVRRMGACKVARGVDVSPRGGVVIQDSEARGCPGEREGLHVGVVHQVCQVHKPMGCVPKLHVDRAPTVVEIQGDEGELRDEAPRWRPGGGLLPLVAKELRHDLVHALV